MKDWIMGNYLSAISLTGMQIYPLLFICICIELFVVFQCDYLPIKKWPSYKYKFPKLSVLLFSHLANRNAKIPFLYILLIKHKFLDIKTCWKKCTQHGGHGIINNYGSGIVVLMCFNQPIA